MGSKMQELVRLRYEAYSTLSFLLNPNVRKESRETLKAKMDGCAKAVSAMGLAEISDELTNIHINNMDEIEFDYNRLFFGPAKLLAPPFESVYSDVNGRVMGRISWEVQRIYETVGFKLSHTNILPDHISQELAFMSYLCKIEETDPKSIMSTERNFLKRHLKGWSKEFSRRMLDGAKTDLYKRLAGIIEQYIEFDMFLLSEMIGEARSEVATNPSNLQ